MAYKVSKSFSETPKRGGTLKQLTVISGKGGTGKTSITAAFASLAKNAVLADCDVDAADLHLILKPEIKKTIVFHGSKIAQIDKDTCTDCKKCYDSCRFDAIDKDINLIQGSCEGCGVCAYVCPVEAITMVDRDSGFAYLSETRFGPMAHAMLNTAEEASGKLVTVVRDNAKHLAEEKQKDLILVDGPPGIGCPVIASITGVDLVLIVTEPTLSAIHDLERILGVAQHFGIPATVCVNKYTINLENTKKIEQYCKNNGIPVVGKLPYDTIITKAMIHEQSIIEFSDGVISHEIREMWGKILEVLTQNGR
jgi:MinD superfamily P-loop ATPase